jgi:hypothetical protein
MVDSYVVPKGVNANVAKTGNDTPPLLIKPIPTEIV